MRTTMLATLSLATLAAAAPARHAAAQEHAGADPRPTVAVMYFNNGAIGKAHEELAPLSKGIADMLITELSANPRIRVVERDQLQKLLDEQNLSTGGRVDEATAVKVGKILGAHHMIFGGFVTDFDGNMRLDVRAVEVETSRIVYVESVTDKTDHFMRIISRIAERANAGMHLPDMPKPARDASRARATRLPFQLAMLYSRAIAEEDRGNRAGAQQLYMAVLEKFPEYAPAERALEKLRSAGSGE
jgi:TolB-like protein